MKNTFCMLLHTETLESVCEWIEEEMKKSTDVTQMCRLGDDLREIRAELKERMQMEDEEA